MKNYFTRLINSNAFFIALIGFVLVLPLSEALVSVFAGIILVVALAEDKWQNKWIRLRSRKILLLVPIIFLIYLASTFVTLKVDHSFYDVKKVLFYLVLPLGFAFGKEINSEQKRFLFYVFSASVILAILVSLFNWVWLPHEGTFSVHTISLISHIRFSFQLILVIWFVLFLLLTNYKKANKATKAGLIVLILFYLGYLVFQQSLTGIVAFTASGIYFLFYLFTRTKGEYKIPLAIGIALLMVIPFIYVRQVVKNFYEFDLVATDHLPAATDSGHSYVHDLNNKMVENGHFVGLYVCEDEMRNSWNSVSTFKYDSIGLNGYPVSSTLIRYLTSKNLKKDAVGVQSLNAKDIENIEQGMANYIFQKKYSLYPRVYQTVWEYYVFTQTGYSNHQSFSQRIEFAKAAVTIIKQHPLFGVGTGQWKQEFAKAFKKNNSRLDEDLYASSHNQYLNFMVKFGIIGFLAIMFLLVYPIIISRRYRDPLFMILLVFMFFANFADSNLESHMGSSFFFFFYCLFLIGPIVYLPISDQDMNN